MTARDGARSLAFGRVAIGSSLMLFPRLSARIWMGDAVDTPGGQVAIRALGVRDAIMGMIVLHTVDHADVGPRWVATCALADGVDALATAAVRRDLPRVTGTVLFPVGAALTAAAGLAFARGLKASPPAAPVAA